MIYNGGSGGYPVGRNGRVLLVAGSLLLVGGFALAWRLDPDPRGFGTHQRLGLPPCSFLTLCGLPCPSCGMTTSFAHFTRGQFRQALDANAGGVLLALFCTALIPWCWLSAARGRLWGVSQPAKIALWCVLVLMGASAANWAVHLAIGNT